MKEFDFTSFATNTPLNFTNRILDEKYLMEMTEERFVLYVSLFLMRVLGLVF